MPSSIYLDNNATTRVAEEVTAAMEPYYREHYGNPHSIHHLGRAAHHGVENARAQIAALLGCRTDEIVFTSCGTEGNAIAIRGLLDAAPDRRKIVSTAVEHPSVLSLLRALESRGAIELAIAGVDGDGRLDLDELTRLVDDRTLLVSVMLAQNETGVIHPVAEVSAIAHDHGALLHVDAVPAAGKIPLDCRALGADFLTISGHKLHAPKGVGALMIRRGLTLAPIWYGGGQELGLRSGTEPVPSLVGFGCAAELALEHLPRSVEVGALRDRLEAGVIANGGISINGAGQPRLPNTSSIGFEGIDVTTLILALDAEGICVSGGAACTSGKTEPTATMKAMGKPAAVRFSLSRYTTAAEIERTIETVGALRAAR